MCRSHDDDDDDDDDDDNNDNNNNNNNLYNMGLGHLLTRSGLTLLEVALKVSPGFFWILVCSFLLSLVICYEAFCLYVAATFFCSPVFCPKLGLYLALMQSLLLFYNLSKCFLLLFLIYFISAAVFLLAYFAVVVQFSLPYIKAGMASVLYNFIPCFL